MSPEPAAIGADDKPCYCVCAYYANLAVVALLQARTPDCTHVVDRWMQWYFAHLNAQSAPDGVPCDHFYRLDGSGETNCVKPGDPLLCRHDDATDSAAATFFSVLWAAHQAGLPAKVLASTERKQQVETLAAEVLKLQQADGLCWAKADYHVKYLEDNSEVFAGLRDLAKVEREIFHNSRQASTYQQAAERVRHGVLSELYDQQAKLFRIAKFEDGKRPTTNLDKWYPDTQAQLWPLLFDVVKPDDSITLAIIHGINNHWNGRAKPDWAARPEQVNEGSLEAADAYAMLLGGEAKKVRSFAEAAKQFKFRSPDQFAGPFNVEDAGWLLEILTRLPEASK